MLQLEWLRTFVAVVETGSFTEAADRLGISQPSVSKHIQHLELYFHADLKHWRGRELTLTEAGQDVLLFARKTLKELTRLSDDIDRRGDRRKLTVVIAAGPTALYHYVPLVADTIQVSALDVRLSTITIVDERALTQAVLDERADIALHPKLFSHDELRTVPVLNDQLIVVANPRHQFASKRSVAPELFSRQPVLVLDQSTETRMLVDAWFSARGLRLHDPVEVGSQSEVRAMLLATPNVGIASRITVVKDISGGRLVEVDLQDFAISRFIYASSRHGSGDSVEKVLSVMSAAFNATHRNPRGRSRTTEAIFEYPR